jgi:hypothetical protein
MPPAATEPLAIPLSRRKIFLLTVGAWAFVALGAWFWTIADAQPRFNPLFVKGAAVAAVLFFGLCGAYGCVKTFDHRPGLVIDSEGIVDNASGLAAGRVPWEEITAIRVTNMSDQRFLTIVVADPARYLARGNAFARLLNAANIHVTGSPINISAATLAVSFEELHHTLLSAFERHKSAT